MVCSRCSASCAQADRDAAAVAVAPGGRGRSLEPRRRQRAGRERARRRDRPLRSGDAISPPRSFPIRYVCGFGRNPPDGVISFDDLYEADTLDPLPAREAERAAEPGPGAHVAVITWDRTADGPVPVARSHAELMAGGLAILLESRLDREAVILSTWTLSSFAGLAATMMPCPAARGDTRAAPAFRPDDLPRAADRDRLQHGHRPGAACCPTCGERPSRRPGWLRQRHRYLARARTGHARAHLARCRYPVDRRACVWRGRPCRGRARARRQACRRAIRSPVRAKRPQRHGRGCRHRRHADGNGGTARPDGSACGLSARCRAHQSAPSQDRAERPGRYRLRLPSQPAQRWW